MKKLFNISALVTVALFIIWIVALTVYVSFNMSITEMPDGFRRPVHFFVFYWVIFGLVYLIKERKAVKQFINKFINE